jgi:hypothetical protein
MTPVVVDIVESVGSWQEEEEEVVFYRWSTISYAKSVASWS